MKLFACPFGTLLIVISIAAMAGCGQKTDDPAAPTSPKAAASELEQAFAAAPAAVRSDADAAAAAMRTGEYEKAVASLQNVRSAPNVSMDQGLAIHKSVVSLERDLIQAAESGDANAKRAYELLKALKRK